MGCYFHGRDSGHDDSVCPETDFNPPMRNAWCRCPADDQIDRQRFFANPDGHGWWDPACKGLVQSG